VIKQSITKLSFIIIYGGGKLKIVMSFACNRFKISKIPFRETGSTLVVGSLQNNTLGLCIQAQPKVILFHPPDKFQPYGF